ncbi:MAG: CHAT domain-containing protein [Deltaproteobacteria bacterium]|nr:CHAT domain-containing protein [Deltaproteobacteria bacterium]
MSSERRFLGPRRVTTLGRSGLRIAVLLAITPAFLLSAGSPARSESEAPTEVEGEAQVATATATESDAAVASSVVRRAANAARRAVLEGDGEAAVRIEAAQSLVEALPPSAPDRLALELHVLRTRMLAAGGTAPEKALPARAGARIDASAPTLATEFARIADAAEKRKLPGPRAWALVYGAELALAGGASAQVDALVDQARLVPESAETWEAHLAAEALHARARLGDEREAIRSLSRARRILERWRSQLDAADYLSRARPIHERLAGLLLARGVGRDASDGAPDAEADAEQARLREVLELLEALKLAELSVYFGDACLADLATTTPERLPGTLLLYPVILEDRVELIVGQNGRLARRIAPIRPAELVASVRALRGALQDPTGPRHRAAAARLFEALIAPLDEARRAMNGAAPTLVVVPTGVLREIPFAALFDARVGRFLIEDVALATLPSLHILPPEPLDPRRTRLLAVGLTEAVEDFSPLPFAARELEAAAARFPGAHRLDAAFTRSVLAAELEAAPYDVVHVASHGRFDARASESFLLAQDGRIGMAELGEWIGRTRPRTGRPLELLVLSACETAIGDERAVLGLAGVAVQAGARSAIASLWKVHDEATMQLFGHFYRELGRPGVSRAEALRRAQRALLAEPRFRHPIYWSAFLLVNGWL